MQLKNNSAGMPKRKMGGMDTTLPPVRLLIGTG
jgi:hypothetical protein